MSRIRGEGISVPAAIPPCLLNPGPSSCRTKVTKKGGQERREPGYL